MSGGSSIKQQATGRQFDDISVTIRAKVWCVQLSGLGLAL